MAKKQKSFADKAVKNWGLVPIIKSVFKNDFYNVNIDNLLIIKNNDLINQINYISYEELLDLDKVNTTNNIRVHNDNKILNILLN